MRIYARNRSFLAIVSIVGLFFVGCVEDARPTSYEASAALGGGEDCSDCEDRAEELAGRNEMLSSQVAEMRDSNRVLSRRPETCPSSSCQNQERERDRLQRQLDEAERSIELFAPAFDTLPTLSYENSWGRVFVANLTSVSLHGGSLVGEVLDTLTSPELVDKRTLRAGLIELVNNRETLEEGWGQAVIPMRDVVRIAGSARRQRAREDLVRLRDYILSERYIADAEYYLALELGRCPFDDETNELFDNDCDAGLFLDRDHTGNSVDEDDRREEAKLFRFIQQGAEVEGILWVQNHLIELVSN